MMKITLMPPRKRSLNYSLNITEMEDRRGEAVAKIQPTVSWKSGWMEWGDR